MTFQPQPTAHKGEVYPSQRALARAKGVSEKTVHSALERGRADFIGTGRGATVRRRPCTVDGVDYPSLSAASQATGIPLSTLHQRLRKAAPTQGDRDER